MFQTRFRLDHAGFPLILEMRVTEIFPDIKMLGRNKINDLVNRGLNLFFFSVIGSLLSFDEKQSFVFWDLMSRGVHLFTFACARRVF